MHVIVESAEAGSAPERQHRELLPGVQPHGVREEGADGEADLCRGGGEREEEADPSHEARADAAAQVQVRHQPLLRVQHLLLPDDAQAEADSGPRGEGEGDQTASQVVRGDRLV